MAANYNANAETVMYTQVLLSEPLVIPAGGSVTLGYVLISELPEDGGAASD